MSDPLHHEQPVVPPFVGPQLRQVPYASEVLLIADNASDLGDGTRSMKDEFAQGLDMESVVRGLVALLDEGQQ